MFFWIRKKVHWSDTDAAGVVWFPNFLGWFEDAEEELYASLGRPRQVLLDEHRFGMPRVELQTKFHSPARAGQIVRVGLRSRIKIPGGCATISKFVKTRRTVCWRRLGSGRMIDGSPLHRATCPKTSSDCSRSFPELAERQAQGHIEIPWT